MMRDITGTFTSADSYAINQPITILNTDVVLVYRNVNSNTTSSAVWQLLPMAKYFDDGRIIDYEFVFNASNIQIRTSFNFNPTTLTTADINALLNNQTFRVVLIPASAASKMSVDYSNYEEVIKFYNIDESKVGKF